MTSSHVSNPGSRQMLTAGALVALLVFGMIVSQPKAGAGVSAAEADVPAAYLVAQAEPVGAMTDSVNWERLPQSADPSATAVAAYGN